MATEKAIDSTQLEANLKKIADAIRAKGGTKESLTFPEGFKTAINSLITVEVQS